MNRTSVALSIVRFSLISEGECLKFCLAFSNTAKKTRRNERRGGDTQQTDSKGQINFVRVQVHLSPSDIQYRCRNHRTIRTAVGLFQGSCNNGSLSVLPFKPIADERSRFH